MKVIFGEDLDGNTAPCLVKEGEVLVGQTIVGPLGIISLLELHLGLTFVDERAYHRVEYYRMALEKNCKGAFFEKSFSLDQVAVAEDLLKKRDELSLYGFNFKFNDKGPSRLKDFCKVESSFEVKLGLGDRLNIILENLDVVLPIKEISIVGELAPPWQKLLGALERKGIKVYSDDSDVPGNSTDLGNFQKYLQGGSANVLKGDGSLSVLSVHSDVEGAKALNLAKEFNNSVYLCPGGRETFARVLSLNKAPSVGANPCSHSRTSLASLKLLPALLYRPMDPRKLLEFLSLRVVPLKRSVAHRFCSALSGSPGVGGKDWQKAWKDIRKWHEGEPEKLKEIENVVALWIEREHFDPEEGAPVIAITELLDSLGKRAGQLSRFDETNGVFVVVEKTAKRISDALGIRFEKDSRVKIHELEKIIETHLPQASLKLREEETGRVDWAESSGAILQSVDQMIWFPFVDNGQKVRVPFWSGAELSYLNEADVKLDLPSDIHRRQLDLDRRAILQARKKLILVVPDTLHGAETVAHPLHADLLAWAGDLAPIKQAVESLGILEESSVRAIPRPTRFWKIKNTKLLVPQKRESYSSLEKIFYYPFQWVLHYKAYLRADGPWSTKSLFALKGSMVHRLFEIFFNEAKDLAIWDGKKISAWHEAAFPKLLEEEGAILLIHGHEADLAELRAFSLAALERLAKLIHENDWTVEKMEKWVEGEICKIPVGGYIDMALARKKERCALDIKYMGAKKYPALLRSDTDLQLAVYSKLLMEGKGFAHTGYFIAGNSQLYLKNHGAFDGAQVDDPTSKDERYGELWHRMEHTYALRLEQLKNGEIEVPVAGTEIPEDTAFTGEDSLEMPDGGPEYNDYIALCGWEEGND